MEIGTNTKEMAIYAEMYYLRFEHFMSSLAKGEQPTAETIEFFSQENLAEANLLFENLAEMISFPLIRVARTGQQVIHHSFWSGEFTMDDWEDGVSTYQKELQSALDGLMGIKNRQSDDYFLHKLTIEDMKDFFSEGYKKRDPQTIVSSFLIPMSMYFRGTRDAIPAISNVVSLVDYRNKR